MGWRVRIGDDGDVSAPGWVEIERHRVVSQDRRRALRNRLGGETTTITLRAFKRGE